MSKHWKRFAAVVVSLTMAFQFCVNDFYAYAETNTPEQETVEQTPPEQQTQPEPEVTTEPVETPAQTEPVQEPAPEVETKPTTPPEQEQPQQPVQEETPAQPEREVAGTLKLEFKDEEGNTLKTVDPIALTSKYVGDTIRLVDLGVDTNVADYTLVDIKDKNDGTKDYNPNSVDFTLTKNITELQLVYRANPKEPETAPTENNTTTTEDSQQGEEDSEDDSEEADTKDEDSEEPKEELKKSPLASMFISQKSASLFKVEDGENVYYEINFVDQDGGSIERQFVLAGQTTEAPILDWSSSTLEEGTQFVGWKSSLDDQVYSNAEIAEKTVEQDITYTAVFKKTEKYTVTVNYVYADGTVAAQPYVAEVELGKSFGTTINLPSIDGFSATSGYQGLDFTFDKDRNTASINISDGNKENKVYTVTYEGEECTYTVVHKFETFTDGEYKENFELASRETLTGTIGLETQASPKEISGFTANPVQQVKLTGEDTVIEITYERNSYVLTYDSDGGTYVAPITLKYGQEIPYPTAETMKKVGYDFAGWDLQQSTPTMPAGNLTVKANWNSAKYASYKVVYWLEKVPVNGVSAGYDYITSEDGSGRVGERISYDELSDWQWEQANIKPQGVELNNQLSNEVVTITPDGQAVKNVYYSRTTFTIKFYRHEKTGTGIFGIPIYDWVEDQDIRITAKYGEDVSDKWATACENNQWATSKYLDEWYTLIANMPAQDKTLYADNLATGKTIYYYIQDLNGERKVYQSFQAGSGVSLSDVDKQPIEGFSFKDWKKDGNPLWLYYERNSYNITFENASGVKDASVKFEASIKSAKPNDSDVEPPVGIDEDYVFGGWYYSPACEDGTEVDWNSDTMPAHNLQVYAKWVAPEYELTFDTNEADNADDPAFVQQTLTKYDEINVPEVEPTKEGYKFLGWYIDKNCESKFVDGQQITKDTTLYAKWEDENKVFDYTIKYVDENGETIDSVTDSGSEGETINIELKDIVKDDGTTYYPAESSKNFVLNEDEMVVTIQYKKAETWSYVVKYLDSETNQSISSEVNKTTQFGVVLETAKFIEGYTLSDDSSFVQIVTKGQSEVTFYYDKIPTNQYTIEYIAKNEDGTERILEESKEPIPANVGEYVTADDKAFEHYDLLSTSTYSRSIVVKEDADKNVIKVYYAPKKYDYTVKYYYETEVGGGYEEDTDAAETVSVEYNTVIDEYTDKVKDGYVFEKVENLPLTVTDDADQNIIKVYYAIDEDGKEGTPDKYEATVTFKVENGYFNGEEGTDSIGPVEYVLATKDETTNTWTPTEVTIGSKVEVPTPSPNTGYDTGGSWNTDPAPENETEVVAGDTTYTYTYGAEDRKVTVNYIDDQDPANKLQASVEVATKYDANYDVSDKVETTIDKEGKHYVLDSIDGNLTGGPVKDDVTVDLIYSLDEDKDGTPDKYEATVTFKVENGYFNGEEGTDSIGPVEYVLATKDETTNTWTPTEVTIGSKVEVPTPSPNTGYDTGGSWNTDPAPENETEVVAGDTTYTYTYGAEDRKVTVNYIDDQDPANKLQASVEVATKYDANYDVSDKVETTIDKEGKHYVLDSIDGNLTGGPVKDDVTVDLIYSLDEDKDGTPDKYEATVTFKVENGYFNGEEGTDSIGPVEYVLATKDETTNTWTPTEVTIGSKVEVPTPSPNTGYDTGGSWNTDPAPENETEVVAGDTTYTYTYGAEDRKVTVNYIDDQDPANKLQASVEVATKYDANYDVSDKVETTIDKEGKHYVLDSIDGNLTGGPVKDDVTVDLIYSLDEDKDGTPDKYEATVTFKVENGYFNGEEGTDSIGPVEYVLATKDETTNTWTPTEVTIGSKVEVPTPSPNTGYDTGGSWNTDPAPENETEVVAGDTTYTYTYGAEDRKVTVNYIDDQDPANKLQASVEVATKYDANYDVSDKVETTIDKEGKHYVLDSIDGNLTGGPVKDDVTVDLIYSLDEDKDGTPDKYEATVTFKVENGYFNGEEGTDSIGPVEYVLATKDETTNTWTPTEVTIGSKVEVPTPSPNTGYDTGGSWNTDPAPENETEVVAGDTTYTYTYGAEDRKVTVNYIDDQDPANKLQASVEVATKYDANYDVSDKVETTIDKEGKHYVLDSIDGNLTGGPVKDDVTVDLIYSLDEDKDGTPDKYEATVTFKVENGYFNGEEGTDSIGPVEYVLATKDETTNTWTPTEVTIGSKVEVPTPSPNTGYDTGGSWNTDPAPENETEVVAGDTTYTYTYGAEDRKVTVNYIDDQDPANKLQASVEVATKYDANYDVSDKVETTIDKEGKHYVLDSIDGNLTGGPVKDDVTVDLIYSLDEDKDGTPDKYEATVTFKVENGYFNGEEGTDSIGPVEYVLATKDETTNTWTPTEVTIGSKVEVPTPSPNTGYDTGGSWNTDPAPENETEVVAGDTTYTYTYGAEDRKVTVNYIDDQDPANKLQASVEVATKYDANYDVSDKVETTIDKEGKHYVLDSIDGNLTGGPVKDDVTVDLIYSLDEDKDGTPDKYEATVTFKVENGYFNGEEGTDSIGPVEYVLATKDETTNTWTPTEVTIGSKVEVPTPSPNTGYDTGGSWNTDPAPENETEVVAGDTTYTYTYGAEDRKVTVNYIDDQDPANKLQASVEVATKYDANYDVSDKVETTIDKEGKHYVLDSIDGNLTGGPVKDDVTVDLIYSLDEDKDGTPDKYEATVTFKVENGYFNGEEGTDSIGPVEYVLATKDETTNTWTPTEVTIGSKVEVPTPSPNTGYDTGGSWNTDPAPENETEVVAGDTTYTYTYERDYATIKITPYTGVYDGQRHNVKEVNGIIAEDTVSYSLDGAQYYSEEEFVKEVAPVNVTNGDQGIFIKVVNNGTEHVYTSADGAFINISKLAITIKSDSASKVFDGTPLTNGNVEITDGELVDKSDVTYKAVGEITNVGKKSNTINVSYSSDQMKSNYDVTLVEGTLTVIPQSINPDDPKDPDPENPDQPVYTGVDINAPSNITYDGNAHQWKPTVTSGNTTLTEGEDEDYTVTYSTSDFTNVTGTITVTIEGTGNYRGTVTRTYQINPRAITLTSAGGTKTYDGTALTNGTVTITAGSLANPSDLTYRATGSQTEVGSSLNYIDVEFSSAQMEANYTVTLQTGTLTVNAAPVTPVTPTPTPGGGDEGTGTDTTPTTGGPVAVADDDADAEEEPEEEEVEDEETPLSDGEEDVDDGKTPLAKIDVWALINLIAAIITVLLGLILLLSKRHKNDDEEDEEERQARIERGEEKEQEQKRGWICKVLGVLVAIGSVVLFILTEDMSLPMVLIDEWTIWMVIIAVVELVLLLVGRHWKDVDDDEEEQAQA